MSSSDRIELSIDPAILGNDTSSSGILSFIRNLTDVEIEDLERLMSLLSNVHLTPSIPDAKGLGSVLFRRRSSEAVDHLFLYCPITLALWHRIFS
ncbi:hypothetical protein CK203_015818 [Vitis vinifera]|uniref:Uncharacterized protein n=1 Tax=Vitis vinifera TaxID=29760 RepID=A0A438JRJ3_VITVI|nr:hypothetical protein CK203_015818 [Vitis vinifera]